MDRTTKAHLAPFVLFMLLLGVGGSVSRYWILPIQTILCGALLCWFRKSYELRFPRQIGFTIFIAVLVFAIWISPQELLHSPRRLSGFDPSVFKNERDYLANLAFRFLRLVIVVPLLEEIFWRGFLLRYFIDEKFSRLPIGAFSWFSFSAVSLSFGLAHFGPDFWPALATGALYNLVAYRTKSLSSSVLAHAITNLLLGVYIMRTGQWGFW